MRAEAWQSGGWESAHELSNDDFRRLVERSVHLDEVEATRRLYVYFWAKTGRKTRAMAERFGKDVADEIRDRLIEKAFAVAAVTLEKDVEFPRNYTMAAVSNFYCTCLRKAANRQLNDNSVSNLMKLLAEDTIVAIDLETEVTDREALRQLARSVSGRTLQKVVQVIRVVFELGVTPTEACIQLHFTRRESETVLRTLRKWRNDPDSPLHTFFGEKEDTR